MKRQRLMTAVGAMALLLGFGATQVRAQGGGAPGGGGFAPPMAFGMGRGGNRLMDPTMSNTMLLLQRNDVRTEIMLSARQREQLEEMQKKAGSELRDKMRENLPDFRGLRDLSPEDRRAKMEEFRNQMQTNMQNFAGDLDKKSEGILRSEQVTRLRQIDLQWRGPLALADPAIAEKLNLAPEQKGKVAELVAEYKKAQQETMRKAFSSFRPGRNRGNNNNNGNDPNGQDANAQPQRPQPPNPEEMQKRMAEAQKELDKVRAALDEKALALLSDEQLQGWKSAQGKKFRFRAID